MNDEPESDHGATRCDRSVQSYSDTLDYSVDTGILQWNSKTCVCNKLEIQPTFFPSKSIYKEYFLKEEWRILPRSVQAPENVLGLFYSSLILDFVVPDILFSTFQIFFFKLSRPHANIFFWLTTLLVSCAKSVPSV